MEKCCDFFEAQTEFFNIIMRPLHFVHETNAERSDHVCLSVRLSARFNFRTAGQIRIKFGKDVITLEATINSYFMISYNW
jgi:hypothetical protein